MTTFPGSVGVIRAVPFASCYVYSPCGDCQASRLSRTLRALIKAGDSRLMVKYAVRVRQQATDAPELAAFFEAADVLVPVPGCAPREPGSASVTEQLAAAFVREGLGRAAWPGLRRIQAVRKSATSIPGRRPSVRRHYETMAVDAVDADAVVGFAQLVLVDDVVTKAACTATATRRPPARSGWPKVLAKHSCTAPADC